MGEGNFSFIKKGIFRDNIDLIFDHVIDLITLVETVDNKLQKSSFRKTIIIHTASIIEALLFWVLKKESEPSDWTIDGWRFKCEKVLYEVSHKRRIVAGEEIFEKKKHKDEKVNLGQLISIFKKIFPKRDILARELNEVRKLRNRQHISSVKEFDGDYSKRELEFVFSVAKEVKELAKKVSEEK